VCQTKRIMVDTLVRITHRPLHAAAGTPTTSAITPVSSSLAGVLVALLLPTLPPPPLRMGFTQCAGLSRGNFSDNKPEFDTRRLIVAFAKTMKLRQCLLDGDLLGRRRGVNGEDKPDCDDERTNHSDCSLFFSCEPDLGGTPHTLHLGSRAPTRRAVKPGFTDARSRRGKRPRVEAIAARDVVSMRPL